MSEEENLMNARIHRQSGLPLLIALLSIVSWFASSLKAEDVYKAVPGWGQQLPNGMKWGDRIQIFDQEGKFLDQWDQFGGDSSITIFDDDTLYAVDTYKFKAVFIGSAKDGSVKAKYTNLSIAEGLAVDPRTRTSTQAKCGPIRLATCRPVPP